MASDSPATKDVPAAERRNPRVSTIRSASETWSDAAPKRLWALGPAPREPGVWRAWQRQLAKRRRPRPLVELVSGKAHPLLWNAPDDVQTSAVSELLHAGKSSNGRASAPSVLSTIE